MNPTALIFALCMSVLAVARLSQIAVDVYREVSTDGTSSRSVHRIMFGVTALTVIASASLGVGCYFLVDAFFLIWPVSS